MLNNNMQISPDGEEEKDACDCCDDDCDCDDCSECESEEEEEEDNLLNSDEDDDYINEYSDGNEEIETRTRGHKLDDDNEEYI